MDKQQFIQYVQSNQKAVRRFLTALCCGDETLADDLAQDTFVKAYISLDKFRESAKFSTWIYRIAYNTFINHRRSVRFNEDISEASHLSSCDEADQSFRFQNLDMALARLSEKERVAICLHYMEGYDINEIANITESTGAAVKQLLSRGRQHLKTLIPKYEV